MKRDWVTDVGIAVVGIAAATLTFTTLRDLAEGCGITGWLAWLVPVTVDAAGIIAARVWLRDEAGPAAVEFARSLAWVCIAESILGNAGQHYMTSLEVAPPWWVVVLVSAVPPATLGAVVHLGHLRTGSVDRVSGPDRAGGLRTTEAPDDLDGTGGPEEWSDPWDRWAGPATPDQRSSGIPEDLRDVVETDQAPALIAEAPAPQHRDCVFPVPVPIGGERGNTPEAQPGQDRVAGLIAAGLGRVQLQRELGVSEHAAKQLIKAHRNGHRYGGETS